MSQRIVLTTTASVPSREIKEVVDIVSAEVAVGMNIFLKICFQQSVMSSGCWSFHVKRCGIYVEARYRELRQASNGGNPPVGATLDYR